MPFVVSAAQAAECFSFAVLSTAMEKLLFSASFAPQAKPSVTGQAGGKYKLTYLHSNAGTFSFAEGLRD